MGIDHDEIRDRISQEWFRLPPLKCRFCKYETPLPIEGIAHVVTEYSHWPFRADVAGLNQQGQLVAVVEVVNTNPPSEQTLLAQSELTSAFYVKLDAFDNNGFSGYCSPFCWSAPKEQLRLVRNLVEQGTEAMSKKTVGWAYEELRRIKTKPEGNVSPWSVPSCSDCERPYHTLEFQYELVDWENPYYPVCIECAAKISGGQWRSPGDLAMGDPVDRIAGTDADVLNLFLSFSDAEFWAKVWTDRSAEPKEAWSPETATAMRLDQVEAAFDAGDWLKGEKLLQPIGAPAWDRPPGTALFALEHKNCIRTARAWRRLREYRIKCLPPSLQAGIRSRSSRRPRNVACKECGGELRERFEGMVCIECGCLDDMDN